MTQELVAYLMQDDGEVRDLPTDELLVAFAQLTQGSTTVGQCVSPDTAAVYGFLQAIKKAMRTARCLKKGGEQ